MSAGHAASPVVLLGALVAGACASAPPVPIVSPTGIVYELGTPPTETRRSQTAELYLRQDRSDRALELALEGIAADTVNPVHFFLAGVAYARLGRLTEANRMFVDAERRYPAYELDIEPERESAWATAFNAGLESYEQGDVDGTIRVWLEAIAISDLRPEAHRNLASVLTLEGRYEEAIDVYQAALAGLDQRPATRVLTEVDLAERRRAGADMEQELTRLLMLTDRFREAEPLLRRLLEANPSSVNLRGDLAAALSGMGREAEAREIYATLLSEEGLQATQLFNFGVALFRSEDYSGAADAFERLTELQPRSRDAWFNLANSLFAAEAWTELASAGGRLVELDPLNENAHLIRARALLESGDEEAARVALAAVDATPLFLGGLQLRRSGGQTRVNGTVRANAAEPGARFALRFTFYDDDGSPIGDETVLVPAPAEGDTTAFEVLLGRRASAYSYRVVE